MGSVDDEATAIWRTAANRRRLVPGLNEDWPAAAVFPSLQTSPSSFREAIQVQSFENWACLSRARRIVRHATHILTGLGGDAFTIAA